MLNQLKAAGFEWRLVPFALLSFARKGSAANCQLPPNMPFDVYCDLYLQCKTPSQISRDCGGGSEVTVGCVCTVRYPAHALMREDTRGADRAGHARAHAPHTHERARAPTETRRASQRSFRKPLADAQPNVGVIAGLAIGGVIVCGIFLGVCILMTVTICKRRRRPYADVHYRNFASRPAGAQPREGASNTSYGYMPPSPADCSLQGAYQTPTVEQCAPCTPGWAGSS